MDGGATDAGGMDAPATADAAGGDAQADAPGGDAQADAPGGDGGCVDLSGFYVTTANSSCTTSQLAPPRGACVTQTGCAITVDTGAQVLTGTVTGSSVALSTETPVHEECTGTATNGAVTITCTAPGLGVGCTFDGQVASTQPSTRACCDVVAQDCGAGSKCTHLDLGAQYPSPSVCVAAEGAAAEGQPCTRTAYGRDTCAAGLLCSSFGEPAGSGRVCQRLCAQESDCGAGRVCVSLDGAPGGGSCATGCDPFGAACAAGTDCKSSGSLVGPEQIASRFACQTLGATAVGATCTVSGECVAGASCVRGASESGFHCRTLCDASHACPSGQTCEPYTNDPSHGFCL